MKIAQVSPLFESVPPKRYGGTERVVSYLTEELVKQGHEVTVFASGDSITSATLVPVIPESVRQDVSTLSWLAYHTIEMDLVSELADSFDIIHFHTDYMHFPVTRHLRAPHVTTMHGRLDLPELVPLFRQYAELPVVSISDSQRCPLPLANWSETVYHGLPADLYSPGAGKGGYFLFLGRISREKGLDRAIAIAQACGMPLYIAAKLDSGGQAYYKDVIKPLLGSPLVKYIGEVGDSEKRELLQGAHALLFPIDWPEPFGLVMIEAFACGTPVVAYRNGSTPEIMEDGVTGFVVNNLLEAVSAARAIDSLDRNACRRVFDQRFDAARMAAQYVQVYERVRSTHLGEFVPHLPPAGFGVAASPGSRTLLAPY
jgi:glycosyltransferase involved in cell wall biosynthesis